MALKFINKLLSREKTAQSMIQPNDSLNVENRDKYTQVIKSEEDAGFKGLKRAFEQKSLVNVLISEESGETTSVTGTISHYDENYEQLLLIIDGTLKRVVFSQIQEAAIVDELVEA